MNDYITALLNDLGPQAPSFLSGGNAYSAGWDLGSWQANSSREIP